MLERKYPGTDKEWVIIDIIFKWREPGKYNKVLGPAHNMGWVEEDSMDWIQENCRS